MIFSQILISLKSEKDLSWITKSEQQMTEKTRAIWKAPNQMSLEDQQRNSNMNDRPAEGIIEMEIDECCASELSERIG